jgi:hypothetical protein
VNGAVGVVIPVCLHGMDRDDFQCEGANSELK